ncbi:hypothetical protein CI109_101650 [Kwoniella shandongensis]|uniref:MICOS complex subunit n=1 Tax=Kwoniella shandongensis TaxID=1734106 RepID=A0A5M6C9F1_9TREE|nr:uncharacterized protein CI109_001225 [Kwoniella shandongensis]KAA5530422.1 hypothetical protein CI109_001225 [Kwoniella shandongensis]
MASFTGRILRSPLVPTSILASTLYMTSTSLSADEGTTSRVRPGFSSTGERLPIYPTPESNPTVTLVETPNPLVPYITQSRESVSGVLGEARGYVQTGVSKWITFERRVEREVKSILPPDEALNPGLIYILISGLSGSVLTRTRSLPIRFLSPPLFTLLAFPYFLPKTSHNIRKYLSDVEDKHFPEFAARHDHFVGTGIAHFGMLRSRIEDAGEDARQWGHKAFEGVEQTTGLRVGEVVSRVEKEKERVQAQQATTVGQQEYKTVGYVVEQKPVAEVVVPVSPEEGSKRMI